MNSRPETEPLKPERKEWLEKMAAEAIRVEPRMAELQRRLLELGGEAPAFTFLEPDIEQLLERGQPFGGRSRLKIGPGKCHENSALLWNVNRDTMFIATGYALSEDGVWRQHSWIVLREPGRRAPIIETTVKRLLYFGFLMTPDEAESFAKRFI